MQVRVHAGDTLARLAQRYHTTVSAFLRANPGIHNANLIFAGQALRVPGARDEFVPHHPARPAPHHPTHAAAGHAVGPPAGFRNGAWGGQCLAWVNKTSGRPIWNTCAKDCLTHHPGWARVSAPRPGELFVMANGRYGHIGYVLGVNKNGTVTVADSNWNLDERMHTHTIPMSWIAGYLRKA